MLINQIVQNKDKIDEYLESLSKEELLALRYDWKSWARTEQLPPEELFTNNDKFIWMYLAGRGAGKTRSLAEFAIDRIRYGGYRYISLVGATAPEVRTIIIEGESGIMNISPPDFKPVYEPSKKKLTWPNGAVANIFYGSEPELSRGAQSDLVWMDELCKWKYPEETYDNIMFGLRLGSKPLCCISTTPKPIKIIKNLIKDERCIVTRGSTYDNRANLAATFISSVISKYEGTRIGRQELMAEILDDNPGALWKIAWIDDNRMYDIPELERIVVAIDPAVSNNEDSNEHGIVIAGEAKINDRYHYFILDDVSDTGTPREWANIAIAAYHKYKADKIIAEKNNGGDMIASTLRNVNPNIPVSLVWASRGKHVRAEPVSALYEQGRVHHTAIFGQLEDELTDWNPEESKYSPNRLDALVWAITELANISAQDDIYFDIA